MATEYEKHMVRQLVQRIPDMEHLVVPGRPYMMFSRSSMAGRVKPADEKPTTMTLFFGMKKDPAKVVICDVQHDSGTYNRGIKLCVFLRGKCIDLTYNGQKRLREAMRREVTRRVEVKLRADEAAHNEDCLKVLDAFGIPREGPTE